MLSNKNSSKMMKLLVLLFIPSFLLSVSIYEIQYTENAGDGTYPSPYAGQNVTTGGIVSAIDFLTGQFFITSSVGGAWNGLYIYDNSQQFTLGDSLIITGSVYEYNGFTEIYLVDSLQLISSGNALPSPTPVSTFSLNTQEAYESVLVSIQNATVISDFDQYNNFLVSDDSGNCNVYDSFFRNQNLPDLLPLLPGYQFEKITGIVSYQYGEYRLNPRTLADIYSPENGVIITTDAVYPTANQTFSLPLQIHFFGSVFSGESYQFTLQYDNEFLEFHEITTANSISSSGEIFVESINENTVSISFADDFSFINSDILLHFSFHTLQNGETTLNFSDFIMNDIPLIWQQTEPITIFSEAEAIGDTITVIQKPLLNIPVLAIAGEPFEMQCIAPSSTTNWQAELIHNEKVIPLSITDAFYDSSVQRWFLTAYAPSVEIFELYDLHISASGGIDDTSRQSVSLLPHFKEQYYFAHITDSHLPTRYYYYNEQSLTDSTSMIDLREVIKDLNIIRPEFVLFTGDIVQEGELEDFQNRRYYSKAQRIMRELEVPVFVVAGNHDIGGWNDTPPPQGTARRTWWRFFGWNYLENPFAAEPYYTQNYSFFYDDMQFIGMEAYNNYDSFMYSVYGSDSFTGGQMNWLQEQVQIPSTQKVLFYHRDFSSQINLNQLNVDLALSGHIHSNDGNIYQHPYDLSTDATCDGKRSYRLIEVNEGQLIPKNTTNSGTSGNKIQLTFEPANDGSAASVTATLQNFQPLPLIDALIKFVMPAGSTDFAVENGTLWQVDFSQEFPICYVQANVEANSTQSVHCTVTTSHPETELPTAKLSMSGFPNPFLAASKQRKQFTISLSLSQDETGELTIYNIKGQKVKTLSQGEFQKDKKYQISWNGKDENHLPVSTGIYFYQWKGSTIIHKKLLLIR